MGKDQYRAGGEQREDGRRMGKRAVRARTIRLAIDSRLEEVSLVGMAVRGIVSSSPFNEIDRHQVELSVVEAVTNAIVHAYQGEPGHDVTILLSLDADRVEMTVCDTGRPLDGLKKAALDYDVNDRQNLPERGMGLPIIQTTMDAVTYESRQGQNTLRMVKRFG